jgi:hypothetical protein
VPQGLSNFPSLFAAHDGTVNNAVSQYAFTTGLYGNVRTGNAIQGDPGSLGSPAAGTPFRLASGLILDNLVTAWNGAVGAADTSATMPSALTELRIGAGRTGAGVVNAPISRLAFWPQRLPNATLQALTA